MIMEVVKSINVVSKENEAHFYQDFYQNAPGMFVSLDAKTGCVVQCNPAFLTKMGYEYHEIIGMPIFQRVYSYTIEQVQKIFEEFQKTGKIQYIELSLKSKDGHVFDVGLRSSGYRDEKNNLLYGCSVLKEISEKTQCAVQQTEHLFCSLMADELAAVVAHELNQPLATVINYLEGCIHRLEDEANKNSPEVILPILKKAVKQTKYAGTIIHKLRDFFDSRNIIKAPSSIENLLQETLQMLEVSLNDNEIKVMVDLPPSLPLLNMDVVQIQQVLINLMRNSINAIKKDPPAYGGEIKIIVKKEKSKLIFFIKDNGVGIPAEEKEKIFTPFQIQSNRKNMGLGLSICQKIINAHKGVLQMVSSCYRETIFSISLPIKDKVG